MVNVPHSNGDDDTNSTTDCEFATLDEEMTSVGTTKDPDPVDYLPTDVDPAAEVPLTVPIQQVIVVQSTPPAAAIAIVAPTARPVAPTVPLTNKPILTTSNGHSNSNPLQHQHNHLAAPNKPYNPLHQAPAQPTPTIMNHVGPPPTIHQQHAPGTTPIYVTATRQFVAAPPIHHHQHVHTIGQIPHGQWPVVDPVFHFGPGFEHQHYCPTHSQGPQPNEHVVFFHVNVGVSVTFLIGGNQEIIRGEFCYKSF